MPSFTVHQARALSGLVLIGGARTLTIAAKLAEYFLANGGRATGVIAAPVDLSKCVCGRRGGGGQEGKRAGRKAGERERGRVFLEFLV